MNKRIFEIDPKRREEMFAEKPYGLILRPVKTSEENVYVCEASSPHDRFNMNRLVDKYAID